jgi:hypothetical protein
VKCFPFSGMSGRGFHNRHHFRNFAFFGIGGSYAHTNYPYDDCHDLVRVRTVMVGDGVASTFAAEPRRSESSVT